MAFGPQCEEILGGLFYLTMIETELLDTIMSARIYICGCGYEKHVQGTTRGEIVCDLCGAEIDESMLRKSSDDSPAPSSSPSAASEPPTSAVPSHVRAAFEEPETPPSPVPETRPASPAESRASIPLAAEPPMSSFDELEPVATPPAAPGTVCARCNRPFKGDWDRVEGEEGIICYNCSNLAAVGTPERLQTQEATARPFPVRPEKRLIQAEKGGPTFLGVDTQSRYFQGALWIAAISTIALSIYLTATDTGAPPPSSSDAGTAAEEVVIPEGFEFLFGIWPIVQVYLAGFIALYLVLRTTGQLPHDKVFRDVVFLGLLVAGLTVIHGMLWFPADVLISGYALHHFLRLRFTDIVITFIVYGLMKFLFSLLWIVAAAAWFGAVN